MLYSIYRNNATGVNQMTKTQFLSRLDTLCAKAEVLQSLSKEHNVSREVKEALMDAKNAAMRALRKFESDSGFNV
jgi:hypothetical protein